MGVSVYLISRNDCGWPAAGVADRAEEMFKLKART